MSRLATKARAAASAPELRIGDRVRLRRGGALGTVFANPYDFRGKRKVGVTWDAFPNHVLSIGLSAVVRVARYRVGERVTITVGDIAGCTGTIGQAAHPDVRPHLTWVIELDAEFHEYAGNSWTACHESELGPYAVPQHARPESVGALKGGWR